MNGWVASIGVRVLSGHETAAGSSTSQNSSPFVNLFHMNSPPQTHAQHFHHRQTFLSFCPLLVHCVVGPGGWAVSVGDGRGGTKESRCVTQGREVGREGQGGDRVFGPGRMTACPQCPSTQPPLHAKPANAVYGVANLFAPLFFSL